MSKKLEGKVALVTGGATGIGLATAKRFVADGAKVVITGRRKEMLDAAVQEIGDGATAVQADAGNLSDLDRLYAQIKQQYGRIDVLFANAGVGELATIDKVSEEHFDKIFRHQCKGRRLHCTEGSPAHSRRWNNCAQRLHRLHQRYARLRRL